MGLPLAQEPRTIVDIVADLRQRLADLIDDKHDVERMLGSKANYLGMADDAMKEARRCLTDARISAELFDYAGAYRKMGNANQSLSKADGYIRLASGEAVDDGG